MNNWRRLGILTSFISGLSIIFILGKDSLLGNANEYGPYQLFVLMIGITIFFFGIEFAHKVASRDDAIEIFKRYRLGLIFCFLAQILFGIAVFLGASLLAWNLNPVFLQRIAMSSMVIGLVALTINRFKDVQITGLQSVWPNIDIFQDIWVSKLLPLNKLLPWFPVVAVFVVTVQFLLFRTNVIYNLASYYPGFYDQLTTYIETYQLHYWIRDRGLFEALKEPLTIKHFAFRGWVVSSLSVISTFLFGNNRISIASVNFLFFVIAQVSLWFVLNRQKGFAAALTGEGLFLFSNIYYLNRIGGLMDMRLDYAGMVMFGLSILSLVFFIEKPTFKKLYLSLFLFLMSLITRSITMTYLLGTQGILLFYFLRRLWIKGDGRTQVRFMFLMVAGTLIEFILFIAIMWSGLDSYYVNLFRSGEGAIRDAEFGLTMFDRPVYYLISMFDHFGRYVFVVLLALFGLIIKFIRSKTDKNRETAQKPGGVKLTYSFLVFIAALLAVFLVVNIYAPSPVVMSVMTIPLVYFLTMLFVDGFKWIRLPLFGVIATVIAMFGFVNYVTAMSTAGQNLPYKDQETGRMVNQIYEDIDQYIDNGENPAVYFMLVDEGLNRGAFEVYWYEHRTGTPPDAKHPSLYFFSIDEQKLTNFIDSADIVVAFVQMPPKGQFEYPFHTSLRELQSIWQPYLETKFTRINTYNFSRRAMSIGLYIRSVP